MNQSLMDARLTEHGKEQARALHAHLHQQNVTPELVVSSPLTRALETASIIFREAGVPLLAHELCREAMGGPNVWDKRSDRSSLQNSFPSVSFDNVADEKDERFEKFGNAREPFMERVQRAGLFLDWLRHREERVIAVTSHAGFLTALLNGHFPQSLQQDAAEALVTTMGNCELRPVSLVDLGASVQADPLAWSPLQQPPATNKQEEQEKAELRGF
jgi:broad specificity phosphatase PhoE